MRRLLGPLVLLWVGCGSGSVASTPHAPVSGSAIAGVSTDVLRRLCTETACADPLAELTAYRDADGRVQRLHFVPSPVSCSHAPARTFDAEGTEVAVFSNEPMMRDSPELAARLEEIAASQLHLPAAEKVLCRDVLD